MAKDLAKMVFLGGGEQLIDRNNQTVHRNGFISGSVNALHPFKHLYGAARFFEPKELNVNIYFYYSIGLKNHRKFELSRKFA